MAHRLVGQKFTHFLMAAVLVGLLVLVGVQAAGAAPTAFDLSWWTVDSGGATNLSAGEFTLSGTAGQPDAGQLSGGDYTLYGGFWGPQTSGGQPGNSTLYLPFLHR